MKEAILGNQTEKQRNPGKPSDALTSPPPGFSSQIEAFSAKGLDIGEFLVPRPMTTFYFRSGNDAMVHAGIHTGDLLVVDTSLETASGRIILAVVEGSFLVRRLQKRSGRLFLTPENDTYAEIEITGRDDVELRGVVTSAVKTF